MNSTLSRIGGPVMPASNSRATVRSLASVGSSRWAMPGGVIHAAVSRSNSQAATRLPRLWLTAWCKRGGQPQHAERGDPQRRAGRLAVPRIVHGLYGAHVAHAAAGVDVGIGVDDLAPFAGKGQTDPVALVRAAGEVGDAGDRRPVLAP